MATSTLYTALENSAFQTSGLRDMLEAYLEKDQVLEVYRAYRLAAQAHTGQSRLSGEPYITHPVAVACILAEIRMDHQSIVAAILHDVIEDTDTSKESISIEFGEEVAELVDGVSNLDRFEFNSQVEAHAENFRKMMLAVVRDLRVIIVKLADRLHNMRTLKVMRPDKRRRIARETLEIYAPIANRLGMNQMRLELEDLGFANLYPLRYRVLSDAVNRARGHRKEILNTFELDIKRRLDEDNFDSQVLSREKHVYSLYKKMRDQMVPFSHVLDVYAFRIIVDSVDMCYRVLGTMHGLYKPVPGRIADYIAIPKGNGYQSLHTVLFGPHGIPIEVQIRTEDMDRVAESGTAAHWLYKSGENKGTHAQAYARKWLCELEEMQRNAGNSIDFLESVKIDLFPDEVYVFSPVGDIIELPRGATAIDFAYAIHTDLGNSCVAARIDRQLSPLRTQLQSGQTIEIITASGAHPDPAWLNFVVSPKARTNIRRYQKHLQQDEATNLGRRLLDKALFQFNNTLDDTPEERLNQVLVDYGIESLEDLYADIGMGNRVAMLVANQLVPHESSDEESEDTRSHPLAIRSAKGMVVRFARCCQPVRGDSIVGLVNAEHSLVIHTADCKNIGKLRGHPEKWIDVEWERGESEHEFQVEIRVDTYKQQGALATISAEILEMGSVIESTSTTERSHLDTSYNFIIMVRDRRHLAQIIRSLRRLPPVLHIVRRKS